jgi:lipopolysaccharide biosynthesis glycosyltransferase
VAPSHGGRIVWLDSDLLVLADVTKMLESPALDDHVVVAARDLGMPTVRNGVLRWETLGIDPELPYMNVGVMAIDLDQWRADDPGPAMFEYLRKYADEIVFLDQDALNVHFAGRFGALDPRWNAIHLTWEPQGAMSLGDQAIEPVRADPWIVHFTSYDKPWRWGCAHAYTDRWFEVLDRTSWAGWRPPAPPPPPTLAKRVRKRAAKELDKATGRVLTKLGRGRAPDGPAPDGPAPETTASTR